MWASGVIEKNAENEIRSALAGGVELRCRVDGRCPPAQLRVREHCRVTPSLSLCPYTQFLRRGHWNRPFLWHATKMCQVRAFGTVRNARRAKKTTLMFLPPAVCVFGPFWISCVVFVTLMVFFFLWLYFRSFVCFLCALVSVFIFGTCGCYFGRGSRPQCEPWGTPPRLFSPDLHARVTSNPDWPNKDDHPEKKPCGLTFLSLRELAPPNYARRLCSAQHIHHGTLNRICCDTHLYGRLTRSP